MKVMKSASLSHYPIQSNDNYHSSEGIRELTKVVFSLIHFKYHEMMVYLPSSQSNTHNEYPTKIYINLLNFRTSGNVAMSPHVEISLLRETTPAKFGLLLRRELQRSGNEVINVLVSL